MLKQITQKLISVPLLTVLLSTTGCGNLPIGIAVASFGAAGIGLTTYCLTGGSGCNPDVIAYGNLIVSEATKYGDILLGSKTTVQEVTEIVANLNADLEQGKILIWLDQAGETQVAAIVAAITALLPIVLLLIPATTSATIAPHSPTVIRFKLSSKEINAIEAMLIEATLSGPIQ